MCLIVKNQHEDIREWVSKFEFQRPYTLTHAGAFIIAREPQGSCSCPACRQNNALYVQVAHHTSPQIGASRIYVLDHLSGVSWIRLRACCHEKRCACTAADVESVFCYLADPPLNETLADYIADGTVHYTWWQYSHTYYEEKTAAENLPPKWVVGPVQVMM